MNQKGARWLARETKARLAPERNIVMQISEVIAGIKANEHAKVLIVGVKGDNFPPVYHNHPQLIFWDADHSLNATIPAAVQLICPTRFMQHTLWTKLQVEAKRREIALVHTSNTGEIKRLLAPLIPNKPDTLGPQIVSVGQGVLDMAPPPVLKMKDGRLSIGVLGKFVAEHFNRDALLPYRPGQRDGRLLRESERLAALANSMGIPTTAVSVKGALTRKREELLALEKRAEVNQRRSETQKANAAAKAAAVALPPVPVVQTVVASQTAAIADDDQALLLMTRDAIAALQLIREKLEDRAQKKALLFEALKGL